MVHQVSIPFIPCFVSLTKWHPIAGDDPESVILTVARRLDAQHFPLSQVGIQFVQIGNERGAAEALQELDDGLAAAHGVRVSRFSSCRLSLSIDHMVCRISWTLHPIRLKMDSFRLERLQKSCLVGLIGE